ncbi:MAG: XdhC/CoxI family protein [Desulfohalobiaceae bacterium]
MESVYHHMLQELDRGGQVVLARVARQHGSAPRSVGAWCLVSSDGGLHGSVGGGLLEAQVADRARLMLDTGSTELISFSLRDGDAAQSGMVCGGDVDVLLERICAESGGREAIARAAEFQEQGRTGVQFSLVPDPQSEETGSGQGLLDDSGKCSGHLPVPEELRSSFSSLTEPGLVRTQSGDLYFIDPVRPQSSLVIFGGGHISLPLARMASEVHFRITVVDDREAFANRERFPAAQRVIRTPFAEALDRLQIHENTYLAIVTRGHLFDREVLRRALETPAAYVGMIGSRRKIRTLFESLEEEGFSRERLDAVHTPIGLDIGAKTPEEIALSIVAELVQVRAERQRHASR